jgi:hypothetical protein
MLARRSAARAGAEVQRQALDSAPLSTLKMEERVS